MSKTFASRPSLTRPPRGRGASTRNTSRGDVDLGLESSAQSSSSVRGRGRSAQVGGPSTRTRSRSTGTSTNTNLTKSNSTTSTRNMYGRNAQLDDLRQPQGETSQTNPGEGENHGGFTVFQPNVRKRQQINEMAQRETAAYERFKQESKPRNLNYVGTTGGEASEHVVRNKQHHDNRFQKVKRQQRQEQTRMAKKELEDRKIESMRKEARRKAEENELSGKTADPEDLRRRREAFLSRIENQMRGNDA